MVLDLVTLLIEVDAVVLEHTLFVVEPLHLQADGFAIAWLLEIGIFVL
jgi:hypothetical protein